MLGPAGAPHEKATAPDDQILRSLRNGVATDRGGNHERTPAVTLLTVR